MNKVLIGINVVLVAAVGFLFYKVNTLNNAGVNADDNTKTEETKKPADKADAAPVNKGNTPTGKIAFINIDKLNEESLEIADLVAEINKKKQGIESSLEALNMEYQKKVEEYQNSAKLGIAPAKELENQAKYIQSLEKQGANKQLQMDNLSSKSTEQQYEFQKKIRKLVEEWNAGRYDYILSYSETVPNMLLANSALEVTTEVIAEMNKQYKAGKLKK